MSDTKTKKEYKYNRLHAAISLKDDEIELIDKIVADKFKNKNQFIEFLLRDYLKKYTDENKQDDVNTLNTEDKSYNQNNNISISDLNNSINILNQSINNLADLIKKDNTNND
ncbi:hypothetical protein PQQ32_01020 [Brachyspira hyodysenteriae]|uniref:hypothetical protein n=1 Tax=Brachyspira hyodysenteriae TaxID=159 RepID=UPI002B256B41|nr:hypothetical protein [Brachyspira hyodysenteriae]WPC38066.1 hypothetical protein PQQ32_01020 [Brachyspira hyodysenteriae]